MRAHRLEELCDSGSLQCVGLIRSRSLGAKLSAWEHLARVRKLLWVEGASDQSHGIEIGFGKHFAHHHLLFFADAVLSGDGPSTLDTEMEDVYRKLERAIFLSGYTPIVEHKGMKVAIASVEYVGHTYTLCSTHSLDLIEHLG